MYYLLENIKLPYQKDNAENLLREAGKKFGIKQIDAEEIIIYKKSLDARNKRNINYTYSLLLPDKYQIKDSRIKQIDIEDYNFRVVTKKPAFSPVIVGFGPAGLFAAYLLAKSGLKPIVIERGESIDKRKTKVNEFWQGKTFDKESNVQFGEGGAGTFSDGKLTSRSKDNISLEIKKILVEFGAKDEILYLSKPHIGTDRLQKIIPAIREEIIKLGGKIFFSSQLTDIKINNDAISEIQINQKEKIVTDKLILAIGHSARDTYAMLSEKGISMEAKPFAVGFRIEHPQEFINISQYGKYADLQKLPAAEYVLKNTNKRDNRSCFSFCMCPGGKIINSSSEENGIVVNGMSFSKRNDFFSNSALVVNVRKEDYYENSVLDGIKFQRTFEEKAFQKSGSIFEAPASYIKDFIKSRKSGKINKTSFTPNLCEADLSKFYPAFINNAFRSSLNVFNKQIEGFIDTNPVIIAPETRTSSPVRINRDDFSRQSVNLKGLYPVGEGAGYAGGIMSAAIDGWRTAEKIIDELL